MSALVTAEQTLTVGELAAALRLTLDSVFPSGVWVTGEIESINRARSGHVYFNLVERSEQAGPAAPPEASVNVVLFRDDKERVNATIRRHGNAMRMADGLRVRICGMLDFYPRRGQLQLRMIAIDPAHTLGALAADREALLKLLADSGALRRNAGVALAAVPLRVGLVTSLGSAAHADVLRVFEGSGFAFTVVEVDTPVQGTAAPRAIAAAIGAAAASEVDVVVLARGGGSRTDLVAFDHESVALAVAGCERPVFTGIGHETDRSVADETAHTACSTPTAAARAVVQQVEDWLERLDDVGQAIASQSRRAVSAAELWTGRAAASTARSTQGALRQAESHLTTARERLTQACAATTTGASGGVDAAIGRLRSAALVLPQRASTRLDTAAAQVAVACRHEIRHAQRHLASADMRVRALDPARILQRGWSLTRRSDGSVLRSVGDVSPGDGIVTHLADGTVESTIRGRRDTADNRNG